MKVGRIILCILFLPLFFTPVFAETEEYSSELWGILPEETKELLSEMGIDTLDYGEISQFTVTDFVSSLLPSLKRSIGYPLRHVGILIAVLLVCMMSGAIMADNGLISKVSVCVCAVVLLAPFSAVLMRMTSVISTASSFMQAYVPIYCGLTAATGQITGASVYSAFLILVCSVLQSVSQSIILPLSSMLIALSAVTSIEETAASAVADFITKTVKWGFSFMTVIAGAVFSLQTTLAAATDGAALRSAKFATSSFIPIVGGMLSESLGTVVSAANAVRAAAGTVGITAILVLLLPTLCELFLWFAVCKLLAFFSSSCKEKRLEALFLKTAGVLSMLTAVTALSGALFIFSTAVTVKTGTGL